MLIGIDASRANRTEKTGVEWYAWHLIQALKQHVGQDQYSWLLYSRKTLSAELGEAPMNWHERTLTWPFRSLWTQCRLSFELLQHRPDVLFVPSSALPRIVPHHSVVTIHDVGFFRHPELYSRSERNWQIASTRDSVRRASRILTVSEYSKQELVHFCDANPDRIQVIYPGVDHLAQTEVTDFEKHDVVNRYRIPGDYFLYVGRLDTKKNVPLLVEAFRRYKEDRGLGDPTALVLAGTPGEGFAAIQKAIDHTGLRASIIQTGYMAEEDKRALYAGAIALVHPSWYEGFGFTPLEALSVRCPVICSRVGSLPEVVGLDNALWFDPSDPEALVRLMDQIQQDHQARQTLADQGQHWASRYTWEQAAAQVFAALTEWSR